MIWITKNGPRSETKSRAQRAPQAQKRGPTYCAWESRILLQVTLGAAPNVAEMHEKGGQNRPFGAKSAKNTPQTRLPGPCHGDHFCTKNGPRSETKSRAQRAPQAQKRGPTYCAWESRILLQVRSQLSDLALRSQI
jgi:hypothetical protein